MEFKENTKPATNYESSRKTDNPLGRSRTTALLNGEDTFLAKSFRHGSSITEQIKTLLQDGKLPKKQEIKVLSSQENHSEK